MAKVPAKTQTGPTIFDYMNSFYDKTGKIYNKNDKISSYMLAMWLSHDEKLLKVVDKLNEMLYNLTDEQVYDYLYDMVPKGRRYIKWVKKIPDDKFDPNDLMAQYGYSKQEAMLYKHLAK